MQQNTEEWLEFRRNKIGASDAPIILGLSPYSTPFQLWEQKIFGKQKEQTSSMARGHALEAQALEAFMAITGIPMMPKVVVHPLLEWQMASFDGVTLDSSTFVEIKCPSREIHAMAQSGELPDYYMAQVQHQMCVLCVDHGYYFSYNGEKGVPVLVQRDDDFIEKLIEKEMKFYDLMMKKEPPALMPKDYTERIGGQWAMLATDWKQVSSQIKALEEKEQEIRKQLIEIAQGQSSMGEGIRITKSMCKGAIQYDNIPELMGVDREAYRKPHFEKWTFSDCK